MGLHRVSEYRKLHRQMGETFLWDKGVEVPVGTAGRTRDGVKLIRQTVPDEVRILVSQTEKDFESADFGPIQAGTGMVSAIPVWGDFILRFNYLDRITLLATGRLQSARSTITRAASGTEDDLPFTPVESITAVYVNGVAQTAANYEAIDNGINWLSGTPSAGAEYVVEYLYHPRFIVLPQRHRTSPTDKNGASLPIHYWLQVEMPHGYDTE